MVYALISGTTKKPYALDKIQFDAITEARSRGLKYAEMAVEFNEKRSHGVMIDRGRHEL